MKPTYQDLEKQVENLKHELEKSRIDKMVMRLFSSNKAPKLKIHLESKKIIDVNNAAVKFYGYTKGEFLQKTIDDLHVLPPEKRHKEISAALKNMSNKYEFQHRLANGEIKDVEIYGAPLVIDNVTFMFVTIFDITDRKRIERDLLEFNTRFIATINALPDILFECDREGRIYNYYGSQPQLLYVTPQDFLEKTIHEILPEETVLIIDKAIKESYDSGKPNKAIYSLKVPNGLTWFEMSI